MLKIPRTILEQLSKEAELSYPAECCGLLVGGETQVRRVVPSPNILAPQGNDVFEIDPQVRFDWERQLRGAQDRIIGHYHSHPDHPAEPSPTDVQRAFEPDLIWLIIPVVKGRAGVAKAYRIDEGRVSALVLTD